MTDTTAAPAPSSGTAPPTPPTPPGPPGPPTLAVARRRRSSRVRLLLAFAVLIGAVVFLLVEGLGSSLDYFDTVDQALNHKAAVGTSTIRLEGTVVHGTVRRTGTGTDFTMAGADGRTVEVHNTGSPPQLFQPGIPVVVDGHFVSSSSRRFLSDQIEVKHSATYIAEHPTRVKGKTGKSVT
ncbi:MAG TPA: cytochrome c maturation protein CcmE [Acidimicrobiales bacterium]|nr:cytochrome c maturation protein CcmE [Acidimicrobiales bacterium]